MKKSRKNSVRKERIIMITSSAFVLAALTMTGLYMREQEIKNRDDGYTLDFTALENSADTPKEEVPQTEIAKGEQPQTNLEDDLDYMPLEAGSGLVEIPGLTDKVTPEETHEPEDNDKEEQKKIQKIREERNAEAEKEAQEKAAEAERLRKTQTRELHFEESLIRPVNGDVMIPYSMDGSVYFATLDQYKYHPATVFAAEEGTEVAACAEGKVMDVFSTPEIGQGVTIDLGDGYLVTYGQLDDICVEPETYVDAGETLGVVAEPTRYYSVEGSNLYFKLEKDGTPVNAEGMF